jgi:predicted phage gp36 major capsid-like protein
LHKAVQHAQQQAFAGTVVSEQGGYTVTGQVQGNLIEQFPAAGAEANVRNCQGE